MPKFVKVPVVKMTPADRARYEQTKRQRSFGGWGNSRTGSWGFGNDPRDSWTGTFANPLDILHPKKVDAVNNPWGY